MPMNQIRKPSAASESFITALAVLFFVGVALLFQFLDRKKRENSSQKIEKKSIDSQVEIIPGNKINLLPIFNGASVSKIEDNTFNHTITNSSAASFCPPLSLLDIPKQTISVDAGAGQLFTSSHQSVITIPPNAFVDKEGNIVKGNVEVRYREFYNYIDFFLSGIPMHYDSGNGSQLESAGMFELTASKDNLPLYVNPESRISVMLASLNRLPGYNLYYFDKQQNKWIYKGESNVTVAGNSRSFRQEEMYSDSFAERFTFRRPEYYVRLYGFKEPAGKRKFILSKKSTTDAFTFHFLAARNAVPGINRLSSVIWRYSGNDAREQFNNIMVTGSSAQSGGYYPRAWNNAMILHQPEDDTYLMTLCDNDDTLSLKIIPKLTTERMIKRFKSNISNFICLQDSRMTAEDERFAKFKNDTANYFLNNSRYTKYGMTSSDMAMRQFQLDGFGIWNCDRPMQIPQAITVNAAFVDENGKQIKPDLVYLADKSVNTIFTYNDNTMHRFKFNPSGQNLVWAVFPGNIIVVIKPKEFREKYAMSKSACTFRVEKKRDAVTSSQQLKEQLRFDI